MKMKSICAQCLYLDPAYVSGGIGRGLYGRELWRCQFKVPESIDPVTGKNIGGWMDWCYIKNVTGDCKDFKKA